MFLKVSIDHLFDNLSLEKEIIVLEKCMEKVFNFGSVRNLLTIILLIIE